MRYKDRHSGRDDDDEKNFFPVGDVDEEGEVGDLAGMLQLDLATTDINLQILHAAIKVLESSWFWKFRSTQNKLLMIRETFKELSKLIEEQEADDEEDETNREEK